MNGPRDFHIEWSDSERERQILYNIDYMWNLEKWYKCIYLQNRNKVIEVEDKHGYQAGKGDGRLGLPSVHYYV